MNIRQKQWQLRCLGYLDAVDGHWGPKSIEATRAFQQAQGLVPDGIFGPRTEQSSRDAVQTLQKQVDVPPDGLGGPQTLAAMEPPADFWAEIPNFTRSEFACKCGCGYPAEPKEALVRIAQSARDHFGVPATVVSGLRCAKHNARVGGVANSQHMAGEACDLAVAGVSADRLLAYLQRQPGVRYAYKINETNVHFDIPKGGS